MDTDTYISTVLGAVLDQFKDSPLSGVRVATNNLTRYYLLLSEQNQQPRWKFDIEVARQAYRFCTSPLPQELPMAERTQLTSAGQRDYSEASRLLPIVLQKAFQKTGEH